MYEESRVNCFNIENRAYHDDKRRRYVCFRTVLFRARRIIVIDILNRQHAFSRAKSISISKIRKARIARWFEGENH